MDKHTYEMLGEALIAELLDPAYTAQKTGGVPLKAYPIIQRRP